MACRAAGRWGQGSFYCPTGETGHLGNRLGNRDIERETSLYAWGQRERASVNNIGVRK